MASTSISNAGSVGLLIPSLLETDVRRWSESGWKGVTPTTADLLHYWFELDRDGPEFHPCQQRAIETIIYCHEILGLTNPYQLYTRFASEHPVIAEAAQSSKIQDELASIPFPKYCLKMATGSGKTWVMIALLVWHYFNARNREVLRAPGGSSPASPLGFTDRFLIVTPGREVQRRVLDAVHLNLSMDLFMPPSMMWRDRFYLELYEPHHFHQDLFLTPEPFLMVTNWQQFRFSEYESEQETEQENEDIDESWVPDPEPDSEPSKAEIIADLLTEYPDICILNDEAHHVHACERFNPKSQREEQLIWRRFISFLHQQQEKYHADSGDGRVFLQIDFTATPYVGSGNRRDYFPHIVYDYPLAQASADMLVKQLCLEQRHGENATVLEFRALRESTPDQKRGEIVELSPGQKIMLEMGILKLEQLTQEFRHKGIDKKPVMLVLSEETKVADLVAQHLETVSNGDGEPYDESRVVVYHSNLKQTRYKAALERLNEIDADDQPLQVVVSVLSIREGFDRHNICVIVMLRASEADLLLEQVVGRGLRLMFPPHKPEYDQLQHLKEESRQQLLQGRSPENRFDCLFLIEHPKFKHFYEAYLRDQGCDGPVAVDGPDPG